MACIRIEFHRTGIGFSPISVLFWNLLSLHYRRIVAIMIMQTSLRNRSHSTNQVFRGGAKKEKGGLASATLLLGDSEVVASRQYVWS
jgi:hypothetical protein